MSKGLLSGITLLILTVGRITTWLYMVPKPQPPSMERLTVGVENSLLPVAVWVADEQGYFAQQGLEVSIKAFNSGKASFEAMLNGEDIDISTVAPTPIMFNSFNRNDFLILATFVHSYSDLKAIASRIRGITQAADLPGMRIGTPLGTTGQYFTDAFLLLHEISPSEVELVDIPPSDLATAMEDSEIDAMVIWEPHAYHARERLQQNAVTLPSSTLYWEAFNFMAMRELTEKRPQVIERFLRAIDKANQFITSNRAAAQALVTKRMKLDRKVVEALWDEFSFELSLNQELIITLEHEARWAIKQQLTAAREIPNYIDSIYWKALEEVKPRSVRALH